MRDLNLDMADFEALTSGVLGRNGSVRFEARGSSMYPFIRNGDVLTAVCPDIRGLAVGDIVLYRPVNGNLAVHRIVRKLSDDGGLRFMIRGDATFGADEYVESGQVLGVVVSRHRNGKALRLNRGIPRLLALLWVRASSRSHWFSALERKMIKGALRLRSIF
jgi:signal peptidase